MKVHKLKRRFPHHAIDLLHVMEEPMDTVWAIMREEANIPSLDAPNVQKVTTWTPEEWIVELQWVTVEDLPLFEVPRKECAHCAVRARAKREELVAFTGAKSVVELYEEFRKTCDHNN